MTSIYLLEYRTVWYKLCNLQVRFSEVLILKSTVFKKVAKCPSHPFLTQKENKWRSSIWCTKQAVSFWGVRFWGAPYDPTLVRASMGCVVYQVSTLHVSWLYFKRHFTWLCLHEADMTTRGSLGMMFLGLNIRELGLIWLPKLQLKMAQIFVCFGFLGVCVTWHNFQDKEEKIGEKIQKIGKFLIISNL